MDPWQRKDFKALDPGWKRVVENDASFNFDTPLRAWLERPRGHSKSADLAVMASWALFASKRKIRMYGAAADLDQAKLLRDAVDLLLRLNPWLNEILKTNALQVINKRTGSSLDILTSDGPSSYGLLPDAIIIDELCHWRNRDLWDSLISSAAKKQSMLCVITNAGFLDSWQAETREIIKNDPAWYFSRLDGPQASWLDQDRLDELKRLLPRIAYNRLVNNDWASGSGDCFSEDDIQNAIRLKGPCNHAKPSYIYFAGLDLGLARDRSAFCVVGKHVGYSEEIPQEIICKSSTQLAMQDLGLFDEELKVDEPIETIFHEGSGRLRLIQLHIWTPSKTQKVEIEQIEQKILSLNEEFHFQIGCDPWQAQLLISRLQKQNVQIEAVDFTGNSLKGMCSAMLDAFNEKNLAIYPDPNLIADLRALRIVEKQYGVRLESPRGPNGHGDAATALSIALYQIQKNNSSLAFTNRGRCDSLIVY